MKQRQRGSAIQSASRPDPDHQDRVQNPDGREAVPADGRDVEPDGKASNDAVLEQDDFGGIGIPGDDEERSSRQR